MWEFVGEKIKRTWPEQEEKIAMSFFNFLSGRNFNCRLLYNGKVVKSYTYIPPEKEEEEPVEEYFYICSIKTSKMQKPGKAAYLNIGW